MSNRRVCHGEISRGETTLNCKVCRGEIITRGETALPEPAVPAGETPQAPMEDAAMTDLPRARRVHFNL